MEGCHTAALFFKPPSGCYVGKELYGYCMVIVWLLYGYCMVIVWLLYGYCMVIVWLLCGADRELSKNHCW